jgi:hypothetical protein
VGQTYNKYVWITAVRETSVQGRHEDLGMLTQIDTECCGATLGSADDEQVRLLHFDLNQQ